MTQINSNHSKIEFTMEMETDNGIPFLDHFIKKKDGHLSFSTCRNPTHRNRYLHRQSHHHPAQLQSVVKTLTHTALDLPYEEHRKHELNTLKETLFFN